MENKDNLLIGLFFFVLVALSVWLQFGVLRPVEQEISDLEKNDPDYYIENFISTGLDQDGQKYQLIADRLVHFPVGDRSLLDNPHIIQHNPISGLRHVYADSGWLYNNRSEVLMTGNVRVIQGQSSSAGISATSDKMKILLKENRG